MSDTTSSAMLEAVKELKRSVDLLIAQNKELKSKLALAEAQGARDLLLYLKMSCHQWNDDTYGEIDERGCARGTTTHTVRFDDSILSEMLGLANISTWGHHNMDALNDAVKVEMKKIEAANATT